MTLFDDKPREARRAIKPGETKFDFVDSIAAFETCRDHLNRLYCELPERERGEYEARLKATRFHMFDSAFFELILRGMFLRQGWRVEPHPDLGVGESTKPDFLVLKQGQPLFVLEAVTTEERLQDGDSESSQKLKAQVLSDLLSIEDTHFVVLVSTIKNTPLERAPSLRYYKRQIRCWLDSLDAKSLFGSENYENNPTKVIDISGWTLRLTAIAYENKEDKSICGSYTAAAGWVSPQVRIKRAILEKARRYGDLGLPYVIAVNYCGFFARLEDLISVLFGQLTYVVDPELKSELPRMYRKRDGLWYSGVSTSYKDLSAVWMFDNADIFTFPNVRHSLVLNPDAIFPLTAELPTNCFAVDKSFLVQTYDNHNGPSRKI